MTQFAAIPTMYNGVQFRSRLEARWAAFFDLCGWRWEYEPFDLNGWIPDFIVNPSVSEPEWLRTHPWLVEVKPWGENTFAIPKDVRHKIENALRAPLRADERKRSSDRDAHSSWHELFKSLKYSPTFIGRSPDFIYTSRWGLFSDEYAGDLMRYRVNMMAHAEVWKSAGNAVQWKAPRA